MLNVQKRFEIPDGGGVYLNKEGKKIFISVFEDKMRSRFTMGGVSVSYGDLIKAELQKLTRRFERDEEYKAYKHFL